MRSSAHGACVCVALLLGCGRVGYVARDGAQEDVGSSADAGPGVDAARADSGAPLDLGSPADGGGDAGFPCPAPASNPVLTSWSLRQPLDAQGARGAGQLPLDARCTAPHCPRFVAGDLVFDGDQWLETGRAMLDPGATWSAMFWMRPEPSATMGAEWTVFTKTLGAMYLNSLQLDVVTPDVVRFGAAYATGYAYAPDVNFTPGVWHHVVGTHEANGTLRLFLDGMARVQAGLGRPAEFDDGPFLIGADTDMGRYRPGFRGAIADVRLVRGVLTPAAIAELAQSRCAPR